MGDRSFAAGGLLLTQEGAIARLLISRPESRNSFTLAMWSAMPEIVDEVVGNSTARILVISGEGTKAFCAGADIGEFPETYASLESTRRYNRAVRTAQESVASLAIPVLAEIRGACFGGGCGLALHCDLRFADESSRFAITPARLGLAYSFEDTARLVSVVGPSRAKDILFSGRTLTSGEALSIGLIDFVVPAQELGDVVADYAASLAKVSQSSIRIAKSTVDSVTSGNDTPTEELQADFEATFSGPDFREGYAAFMEKRKPRFG